jgi:hypothetical protein
VGAEGTPKDIVAKLPPLCTRKRLDDLAQESLTPDQPTPEALQRLQKAEAERRWPIVKAADIKVERWLPADSAQFLDAILTAATPAC